ncbi:MAG: metallopeptidase family protein [Thermoleophilia bacterium]|nr:metallopeptidase family protein [Thermoleophilia bacterium]
MSDFAPGGMTRDAFEALVLRAIDEIPDAFRDALDTVAIVVEDDCPPGSRRAYGLYHGVPRTAFGGSWHAAPPARISIYMRPLVSDFPDPGDLVHQVRVTVLHEVGHHLGMDEDQLADLGYG